MPAQPDAPACLRHDIRPRSRRPPTRLRASRACRAPSYSLNGVFDLLHRGHVTYLEQARPRRLTGCRGQPDASVKRLGKGDERPLNAQDDRMAVLAALAAVDLVKSASDADTPRELIMAAMPDILVKGGDYTAATTAGAVEVIATGGRFVAIPFAFERSAPRSSAACDAGAVRRP